MKFKIYKGLSTNLEGAPKIEGCWYITTDTQELYVCFDGVLHHVNDASSFDPTEMQNDINNIKKDIADLETKVNQAHGSVTVKSYGELPNVGSADIVYIIEDENAIYRWDATNLKYFSVGRDYNEIEVIYGGSATTE